MKQRLFLFSLALLSGLSLFAQTKKGGLIQVMGTGVFLQPPGGFQPALDFAGFELGNDVIISVEQNLGADFRYEKQAFNRAEFKANGYAVIDFQEVEIDGHHGLLAEVQANPATTIYELLFGDSTFTVYISSYFPATQEGLGRAIKSTLLDLHFKLDAGPFGDTFFRLNDTETLLQFADYVNEAYLFSEGGSIKVQQGAPVLVVRPLKLTEPESPKLICQQLFADLREFGLISAEVSSTSRANANGHQAFELIASGKNFAGKDSSLYLRVVTEGVRFVVFQATVDQKYFRADIFRELINTVEFK